MGVVFVRHGRTLGNASPDGGPSVHRGWLAWDLSPDGEADARAAAQLILDWREKLPDATPLVGPIDTSDLAHAAATAEILGAVLAMEVTQYAQLRTQNIGDLSGQPVTDETRAILTELIQHPDEDAPGGESVNDWLNRLVPFIRPLVIAPEWTIVVSHGRPALALMGLSSTGGVNVDLSALDQQYPVAPGQVMFVNSDWSITKPQGADQRSEAVQSRSYPGETVELVAESLTPQEMVKQMATLGDGWQLHKEGLTKLFEFPNRRSAAAFCSALFSAANQVNHHPDITVSGDGVYVTYITHATDSITQKDFAGAATADQIAKVTPALMLADGFDAEPTEDHLPQPDNSAAPTMADGQLTFTYLDGLGQARTEACPLLDAPGVLAVVQERHDQFKAALPSARESTRQRRDRKMIAAHPTDVLEAAWSAANEDQRDELMEMLDPNSYHGLSDPEWATELTGPTLNMPTETLPVAAVPLQNLRTHRHQLGWCTDCLTPTVECSEIINLPDISAVKFPAMIGAIQTTKRPSDEEFKQRAAGRLAKLKARRGKKSLTWHGVTLGRLPTPFEASVMSLTDIVHRLTDSTDALVLSLTYARAEALEAVSLDSHAGDATRPILEHAQLAMARYGATEIRNELRRQGVVIPEPTDEDGGTIALRSPILRGSLELTAEGLNHDWGHALQRIALRARRSNRRHAGLDLASASLAVGLKTVSRKLLHEAFSGGRSAEMLRLSQLYHLHVVQRGSQWCVVTSDYSKTLGCHGSEADANAQLAAVEVHKHTTSLTANAFDNLINVVVQSAVLDTSTCDPCRVADGTTFIYGSAQQQEYEPPYYLCEGGDLCRCEQVPVA